MDSRDQFKGVVFLFLTVRILGMERGSSLSVPGTSHLVDPDSLFLRNVGGSDEVYKEGEFKRSKAGSRSKTETRKSAGYLD